MPSPSTIVVFSVAAGALLLTPGPSVLYIVTRSVDQGRTAGLASVAGIGLGTLVHVVIAAAGLSALVVSSATGYAIVKWAGGGYLILLGSRRLLWTRAEPGERRLPHPSLHSTFCQGVVVNVLNPKTALFVSALLPQFIDPAQGPVATQAVVLGLILVALGLVSDGTYAMTASMLGDRLRCCRIRAALERTSGFVYIALGAFALAGNRSAPVENHS